MTEPLDLLKERLKEIESIDCKDIYFTDYKKKYVLTIRFLEIHGFCGNKRNHVSEFEKIYIKAMHEKYDRKDLMALFNINKTVLNSIIAEK